MSTPLSENFTLEELCVTDTDLPNVPPVAFLINLKQLATKVLQRLRNRWGKTKVNSAYRSPAVNTAVGGAKKSDHMEGKAADIKPLEISLEQAWAILLDEVRNHGLQVDQAIIYVRAEGRGWIHVSHRSSGNRGQLLVESNGDYTPLDKWHHPLVLR